MMIRQAFRNRAVVILLFLLFTRLVAMVFIPLNDHTEARYAEIARLMLESGNWVTPMQSTGVPFWAKPPLSTWLSAGSMGIFGAHPWAARMPALLLSLGVLWLIWHFSKKHNGLLTALVTTLILSSSVFFCLNAGAVMTDPALVFCTTLSLIAFWECVVNRSQGWGYLFFLALGLGLLAKGPIALVLTGMPIFFWVLRHKYRWIALWQQLPWFSGVFLMLLVAMPWYLLAEFKTPGFLNYFIIGEHFHRFVNPGWGGDKYGFAHTAPFGMIWIYAFVGMLPWSVFAILWLIKDMKLNYLKRFQVLISNMRLCNHDGWVSYLILCAVIPLVFFTFSSNIIYPYVFPSLPFIALLIAEIANRFYLKSKHIENQLLSISLITGIGFLVASVLFVLKPQWVSHSQDRVIAAYQEQPHQSQSRLIYWLPKLDFSAQFYSYGQAIATINPPELSKLLSNYADNYLVIHIGESPAVPGVISKRLIHIKTIAVSKDKYVLYRLTNMSHDGLFRQEPH